MRILKRNGTSEDVNETKINTYLTILKHKEPKLKFVDVDKLVKAVNDSISSSPKTEDIPNIIAECSAALTTEHHHYSKLAGRAIVSSLHKETPKTLESVRINKHLFSKDFKPKLKNITPLNNYQQR